MTPITFHVPGLPATAGSKRGFVNPKSGRVVITDDCRKGKPWRERCLACAVDAFDGPPIRGPIALDLEFTLPRPKGHYGSGRNAGKVKPSAPSLPTSKPDTTKMLRALEDALKGVLWIDDSQVTDQAIRKRYGDAPGVHVTVRPLEPQSEPGK